MTENIGDNGRPQRDNAEHEEYAGASRHFKTIWGERDSVRPELLDRILDSNNLNRAYKKVKANKGAPGVDGMTVEDLLPWFKEHRREWIDRIYNGKYTPDPVLRVEIPKPNGGVRKLGIPTARDRVLQEAIVRQLTPIYEPIFMDGSYGYRPNRGAKKAVEKVRELAEQGYTWIVDLDIEKFFDNLDHDLLLNLLRRRIKDERVVQIIKRMLKGGIMVDGVLEESTRGSIQGSPLSPLLSNVYLHEFDAECARRGIPEVRYADDTVVLARSKRAAERILESATRYLEGPLKLTVNREKSCVVSAFSISNFKFLGFCLSKTRQGVIIRIHPKAKAKFKARLKELSSRKRMQDTTIGMAEIEVYVRGWLNYYGIASMKTFLEEINSWLIRRMRMVIWRHWKRVRTRMRNLIKLGVQEKAAYIAANSRRGPWLNANLPQVKKAISKERLIRFGYYDIPTAYQSLTRQPLESPRT